MELQAGELIEVTIRSPEVYGLHCTCDQGNEVIVLIPDISWIASFASCKQFADVGDRFTVMLLRVDPESGTAAASIKARFPDPWSSGLLIPGTERVAKCIRLVDEADRCDGARGCLLELVPGAYAMLCTCSISITLGHQCKVRIEEADAARMSVRISLVDEMSGQ